MGYEIIWEERGVLKHFVGHITNDDLAKCSTAIQSDARLDMLRYVINDFRDCIDFATTDPALIEMAAIDEVAFVKHPSVKIAIVTSDREAIRIGKQYAIHHQYARQVQVLSTMDDARAWVGLPALSIMQRN